VRCLEVLRGTAPQRNASGVNEPLGKKNGRKERHAHARRSVIDSIAINVAQASDALRASITSSVYRPGMMYQCLLRKQVDGSSMALLGNTADEDMRLMAEMTLGRLEAMCSVSAAGPAPSSTSHVSAGRSSLPKSVLLIYCRFVCFIYHFYLRSCCCCCCLQTS